MSSTGGRKPSGTGKAAGRRAILLGPAITPASLRRLLVRVRPDARDLLVGVDGGVRLWRALGLKPALAVGDWDSLAGGRGAPGARSGSAVHGALRGLERVITLPREKDRSDLYHAIRAAAGAPGVTRLVCLGVTGGRPDHHLATLFELAEAAGSGRWREIQARDPEASYHFVCNRRRTGTETETETETAHWSAKLKRGQLISIFALGAPSRGVTLRGFRYPLRDAVLSPSSHGLSNISLGKRCSASVRRGHLLVVIPGGVR